jgi:hypothetical protein
VIFGEARATALIVRSMLSLSPQECDERFDVFRHAATQLSHAKCYERTYALAKANIAKLAEHPELRLVEFENLERLVTQQSEEWVTREWRDLLSLTQQQLEWGLS